MLIASTVLLMYILYSSAGRYIETEMMMIVYYGGVVVFLVNEL